MTGTGKKQFTVLISSAGRRVSLLRSMREAIEAAGLHARALACDMTEMSAAMQVADARFVVPRCTDAAFEASVTELCASQEVDLVVPTIDTELPVWARLKTSLGRNGTVVAVSTPEAISIAADKRKTNAHCTSVGIPVPRQGNLDDASKAREQWPMPVIVKPAGGSAGSGVHTVETWTELDQIRSSDTYGQLIVEQRLNGVEHTVDVFVDRAGIVHCPVVRRRLEVRAGEVSKGRIVRDDLLASMAVKTVEALPGAYGVLNVQIFSDGITAGVVEINARFGGGYPLTWRGGGRYSEWLVREVAFGDKPPTEPRVEYGLTMLRWDDEVFVHA